MPFSIRPYRRLPVPCSVMYNAGLFLKLPLAYCSGVASLITLLLLSSGPAYAGWVAVAESKQEGQTIYVNPDTIRRNGNLVKMWGLFDYKTVQNGVNGSPLSQQVQNVYDCAEERFRMLASANYSGNMASGNLVYSTVFDLHETTKWQPVFPGSVGLTMWKVACAKKRIAQSNLHGSR